MGSAPKKGSGRRRRPVLYQLEPISSEGMEGAETGPLRAAGPFLFEGELEGSIIVSVPETMSGHAAQELNQKLSEHFGGKDICIVTHNISFLRLRRMSPREAAKISARLLRSEPKETPREEEAENG